MNVVYLSIGSNLGDRAHHLQQIAEELQKHNILIRSSSSMYVTSPWGVTSQQDDYYNQALCVETDLFPFELLNVLKKIEMELGRTRKGDYQPRTADIDIILFNDWVLRSEQLTIPHPQYHKRLFVLIPLSELDVSLQDPILHLSIQELILQCTDKLQVTKLTNNVL